MTSDIPYEKGWDGDHIIVVLVQNDPSLVRGIDWVEYARIEPGSGDRTANPCPFRRDPRIPARPVARLSMMTTSWCCARVSARFEPMNPAPPVTMERKTMWMGPFNAL